MKKITALSFILWLIINCACSGKYQTIFVSPGGNDGNPGSKKAPLRRIEAAIEKALILKKDNPGKGVEIRLLPGEYHLDRPILITPELNSLVISGSGAAKTTVKGSRILHASWETFNEHIWVTTISDRVEFDQLFINGRRQILARYPNYDENGGHWQGHAPDAISAGRISGWKNPLGAFVHAMHGHEWGDFHFVISGIDEKGEAVLEGGFQNNRPTGLHKKYRMVENVFEELDSPGEWFYDKKKGKLYFWPPEKVDLQTAVVEVPVLKHIVEISGSKATPVRDIVLRGIRFEQARRTFMEAYHQLLRSDWSIYRGGAVRIQGAENCTINCCEFTNLGGNVIFVNGYNRNIHISGNHIHECGASAIAFVGDPSAVRSPSFQYGQFVLFEAMDKEFGPKNELFPADCSVRDNLIHRIGRSEKQVAGVQISMAKRITVSHNSIYDLPRAGINISEGTWGGHVIEFNDVFNTVLESGDHGSFNSWGRDRFWHPERREMDRLVKENPEMPSWDAIEQTVIRNNRFRCDHGWDIDLDDGSSNYHIYNNLCLNGGIKLREGFFRTVENNIMVNNGFHPHVWFKNSGDVFRKNIVMVDHKDIRLAGWGKEIDFNLFPTEQALSKPRANGTDRNSRYGNPRFRAPERGDFSVENGSPALELGFKNFPMNQFGVQKAELKALAGQPEIPVLHIQAFQKVKLISRLWLGATIKNIDTPGERSAAGLEKEAGVLILKINPGSLADLAGLKTGDVITGCEKSRVNTMGDLLSAHQGANWMGRLNLTVIRDQVEVSITIRTK